MNQTTPSTRPKEHASLVADEAQALSRFERILSNLDISSRSTVFQQNELSQFVSEAHRDPLLASFDEDPLAFINELSELSDRERPPTVVFAKEYDQSVISTAVAAGADAYLTEEPNDVNVQASLRFAIANRNAKSEVSKALEKTRRRLSERAEVERAKYQLMLEHKLSENEAHALLRGIAMEKCVSIGAVATEYLSQLPEENGS